MPPKRVSSSWSPAHHHLGRSADLSLWSIDISWSKPFRQLRWSGTRPEHLPLQNPTVEHKYLCLHHSAIHVGHEEQSTTPSLWRTIHRFLSAKWVLLCSNDAFSRTKLSKGPEYRSNLCTSKELPSAVVTLTWILSDFFPVFYRSLKQKLSFPRKISPVPKNWPFQKKEMNPLPTNGIFRGELVRRRLFSTRNAWLVPTSSWRKSGTNGCPKKLGSMVGNWL